MLIWPVERSQLSDLLIPIRAGGTYRPTVVREQHLLTAVPLRAREEEVVRLRLAGCSVEAAAAAMGVTVATIRRYERRILERVEALDPAERPAWVRVLARKG